MTNRPYVFFLCIKMFFAFGCLRGDPLIAPCASRVILEELRLYQPRLIAPSPDEMQILTWAKYSDGAKREGLTVTNTATGKVTHSMRSRDPALRVLWRPDRRAISYFIQETGTNRRRLFLWELDADRHREIEIPFSYAQALLKWSPDGKRFAFTSDRGGLVILQADGDALRTYAPDRRIRSFDWSTDSRHIAVIDRDAVQAVTLVDAVTGSASGEVKSKVGGYIREVSWRGSRNLLLLTGESDADDEDGANYFTLTALDPSTEKAERLIATDLDVRSPIWLPDGKGFLWHQREVDGTQKILISSRGQREPRIIDLKGALNFRAFSPDRMSMVIWQVSPTINRFVRVPLQGGSIEVVAQDPSATTLNISEENIHVRSADGTMVPILVARASGNNNTNAAIVRMYGGAPNLGATWAETQLYLKRGLYRLQVGNRKPHGARDLIAACNYAHSVLKIPRERIVVLGASTAATVALEAVVARPDSIGVLALIGVMQPPDESPDSAIPERRWPRLLAFHGEKDRTASPAKAQHILKELFGEAALQAPRGMWHVFPGEDHTLKKDESLAVVHATIFRELELLDCDQ